MKLAKAVDELPINEPDRSDNHHDPETSVRRTRSSTGITTQFAKICFICNEVRPCEGNKYREGGLGVCEFVTAAQNLEKAANLITENRHYYDAKVRLELLTSGQSNDVYSAEVGYHRSCYSNFINVQSAENRRIVHERELHKIALDEFFLQLQFNIVQRKMHII